MRNIFKIWTISSTKTTSLRHPWWARLLHRLKINKDKQSHTTAILEHTEPLAALNQTVIPQWKDIRMCKAIILMKRISIMCKHPMPTTIREQVLLMFINNHRTVSITTSSEVMEVKRELILQVLLQEHWVVFIHLEDQLDLIPIRTHQEVLWDQEPKDESPHPNRSWRWSSVLVNQIQMPSNRPEGASFKQTKAKSNQYWCALKTQLIAACVDSFTL